MRIVPKRIFSNIKTDNDDDDDEKNEDKNGERRSINKSRCNTFDNYQNAKDGKSIC